MVFTTYLSTLDSGLVDQLQQVVVRNKAAEICEKYLTKGDKVYVEGKIKTRKWQDESGNDRYSTEINVDEFTFLSTKSTPDGGAPPAVQPKEGKDDLPF